MEGKQTLFTQSFSHVLLFGTPWTVACQAPLSMEVFRQEYKSGLPFPPPGDLPNPWIEPAFLTSPELAGGFFTTSTTWEASLNRGGGREKAQSQRRRCDNKSGGQREEAMSERM